ncbi:MAG: FeoA domain-containing protein [Planctomycetota bacterium]
MKAGQSGIVLRVVGDDTIAQRLLDQGLWPGAEVKRVLHALGGDPILFALHGYRLAVRRQEAARVQLEDGVSS